MHRLKKMHSIGFQATTSVICHRLGLYVYDKKFRFLTWKGTAHHTWADIEKEYKDPITFQEFLHQARKHALPTLTECMAHAEIDYVQQAELLLTYGISLLGSDHVRLDDIMWHEDIRAKQSNIKDHTFEPACYYKDISIIVGRNDILIKDIKVPWEFSRFQYLFVLGKAFEKTQDERYAAAFIDLITRWFDTNYYLRGPNWVCPMDVAIRSLNWIIGFWLFKDAPRISTKFWERFICSLYDHMLYLEYNWEIYDTRTSNHYLSDLVGYLYLTYFFKDLRNIHQKQTWVVQELCKEFEKQVFFEGADYEGSTYYHGLVTELFYHAYILCMYLKIKLPFSFAEKLKRMFEVLYWWIPHQGSLIQIGDNDSGKIVQGITSAMFDMIECDQVVTGTRHFDEFGLSVIKTDRVHVSLRHHAYQKKQPSGHFHNDAASFTFVLDGIPIIVDPGTYVYTPSDMWRNKFRSITCHNTSYIVGREPIPLSEQLFVLDIPEKYLRLQSKDSSILQTLHDLYKNCGLRFNRSIKFDEAEQTLTILDWWEKMDTQKELRSMMLGWNFTFYPGTIVEQNNNEWIIRVHNKIITLRSTLHLQKKQSFYSPSYGTVLRTHCLQAENTLDYSTMVTTISYE